MLTIDQLINKYSTKLQKIYHLQTASDNAFVGLLSEFARDLSVAEVTSRIEIYKELPGVPVNSVVYVDSIGKTPVGHHAMLWVSESVAYHSRLNLLLVDKSSLPDYCKAHLP